MSERKHTRRRENWGARPPPTVPFFRVPSPPDDMSSKNQNRTFPPNPAEKEPRFSNSSFPPLFFCRLVCSIALLCSQVQFTSEFLHFFLIIRAQDALFFHPPSCLCFNSLSCEKSLSSK